VISTSQNVLRISCKCDMSMKRLRTQTKLFDQVYKEQRCEVLKAMDAVVSNTIAKLHGFTNAVDAQRYKTEKGKYDLLCEFQERHAIQVMERSTNDSGSFHRQHTTLDVVEEATPYPMEVFIARME
jgi:hypothetical protein